MVYVIKDIENDIEDLASHMFNIDQELLSIINNNEQINDDDDIDNDNNEEIEIEEEDTVLIHKKKRMKGSTSTSSSPSTTSSLPSISISYREPFQNDLIKWYQANRRLLPWRGDEEFPITPYGVWISEVMLQQTRVETVIEYWRRWMKRFPTVSSLASAQLEEVHQLWAGLGYYRRAENLLKGAKYIMENYNGELPASREKLLLIPGIGPYTAGAISSIAFNQVETLVDGNVMRVFSRIFLLREKIGGRLEKVCWKLADDLIKDVKDPRSFNQGLMELGATICKPLNPSCSTCPVRNHCYGRRIEEIRQEDDKKLKESLEKFEKKNEKNIKKDDDKIDTNNNNNTRKISSFFTKVNKTDNNNNNNNDSNSLLIINLDDDEKLENNDIQNNENKKKLLYLNYFPYKSKIFSTFSPIIQDRLINSIQSFPISVVSFPFKADKKAPKDITKLVYVVEIVGNNDENLDNNKKNIKKEIKIEDNFQLTNISNRFLFIKRPSTGLLANQWEFPSIDVTSLTENSAEKLYEAYRSRLEEHLVKKCGVFIMKDQEYDLTYGQGYSLPSDSSTSKISEHNIVKICSCLPSYRTQFLGPIPHIFSHEKHMMYLIYDKVEIVSSISSPENDADIERSKENNKKRKVDQLDNIIEASQVIWKSHEEIIDIGITTGNKKILELIRSTSSAKQEKKAVPKKRTAGKSK